MRAVVGAGGVIGEGGAVAFDIIRHFGSQQLGITQHFVAQHGKVGIVYRQVVVNARGLDAVGGYLGLYERQCLVQHKTSQGIFEIIVNERLVKARKGLRHRFGHEGIV